MIQKHYLLRGLILLEDFNINHYFQRYQLCSTIPTIIFKVLNRRPVSIKKTNFDIKLLKSCLIFTARFREPVSEILQISLQNTS